MLRQLGAKKFVTAEGGEFWALYDAEFNLALASPEMEGMAPALTCRSIDVETLRIDEDTVVRNGEWQRRVLRVAPTEDGGQSILVLGQ